VTSQTTRSPQPGPRLAIFSARHYGATGTPDRLSRPEYPARSDDLDHDVYRTQYFPPPLISKASKFPDPRSSIPARWYDGYPRGNLLLDTLLLVQY